MEYIRSLAEESRGGCFLCDYASTPDQDDAHHVVWRTADTIVLMNRFPYTNGHLLIAPLKHGGELDNLNDAELASLLRNVRDAQRLLKETVSAHGFNIGINIGLCAGAGVPDHLHVHVVPRWNGDTNFMAVLGDVRVIPDSLIKLHANLRSNAARLQVPSTASGGGS